jgi:hypothetical protein
MPYPVLALDGHDGTGKTELARGLARCVGARVLAPFQGERGRRLIGAYESGRYEEVVAVGAEALAHAVAEAEEGPLILDRSWLTVSTLLPEQMFRERWRIWPRTVLLWCNLETTMERLARRSHEAPEERAYHAHFLPLYLERRRLREGPVIRTDLETPEECLRRLEALWRASAAPIDPV